MDNGVRQMVHIYAHFLSRLWRTTSSCRKFFLSYLIFNDCESTECKCINCKITKCKCSNCKSTNRNSSFRYQNKRLLNPNHYTKFGSMEENTSQRNHFSCARIGEGHNNRSQKLKKTYALIKKRRIKKCQ